MVFERPAQFTITKNNELGVLPTLEKSFSISFQLFINTFNRGFAWRNILHFTIGQDNTVYGDRTPGLWIHKGKFYVSSAINGNIDNAELIDFPFQTRKWYNIDIQQQENAAGEVIG